MKIVLKGNPKSTGSLYRTACRGSFPAYYMTKEGKDLKIDYQWQVKSQYKKKPLTEELEIFIKVFVGTKRKCDWDNFHKISMDALTGIVWEDDSQIKKAHVEMLYDRENPRIELDIKPLYKLSTVTH